jgi:hypothetical protein
VILGAVFAKNGLLNVVLGGQSVVNCMVTVVCKCQPWEQASSFGSTDPMLPVT